MYRIKSTLKAFAFSRLGGAAYQKRLAETERKLARAQEEAKAAKARAKALQEQRDLARQQRDQARQQREVARQQREAARQQREDQRAQKAAAQQQQRAAQKEIRELGRRVDDVQPVLNYFSEISKASAQIDRMRDQGQEPAANRLALREVENGVKAPFMFRVFPERRTPPAGLAFVTVANASFVPGLETLLSSLLDVYPDLASDIIVFHDGTLSAFVQDRLREMYPRMIFEEPDMSWLAEIPADTANRKRIGLLGYMSLMALTKTGYERVVVLDSDVAIIDDISMLWTGADSVLGSAAPPRGMEGEHIFACYDYGARPWAAVSPALGRPILNSGVISIPRSAMTDEAIAQMKALAQENARPYCLLLDRFADQKVWNRFMAERPVQVLPVNFNCNIRYLDKALGGDQSFIRLIHFTGTKPWFNKAYLDDPLIVEKEDPVVRPRVWKDINLRTFGRLRQRLYQREIARPGYFQPARAPLREVLRESCLFIGNGPSLKDTDLAAFSDHEKFAFNWFILHDDFDRIRPEHLVLGSHMLFGGWQTQNPQLPQDYLDKLYAKAWRPRIWTSFYFRPYVERIGLSRDFDVRYVMFEKPHKSFIDVTGTSNLNIDGFVHDGRTGVLSLALPIAVRMGYTQIGLVGCDSNYNQPATTDSNYFYDPGLHVSKETRQTSLTHTWTEGGPGHFAYLRCQEALERRGGTFIDYTLNGSLPLPKGDIAGLRQFG